MKKQNSKKAAAKAVAPKAAVPEVPKAAVPDKAAAALASVSAETALTVNPAASAPVVSLATEKRISHLKLGPALLASGASDAEILAAFTKSFTGRGVTSAEFIAKRAAIYMNIARKAAAKARKAAAAVSQ